MKINYMYWIAYFFVIVGALNWGLVGIWNLDLVAYIFGAMTTAARVVYILVAISGLYLIFSAPMRAARKDF